MKTWSYKCGRIDDALSNLEGLLVDCPSDCVNPGDCPVCEKVLAAIWKVRQAKRYADAQRAKKTGGACPTDPLQQKIAKVPKRANEGKTK